MAPPNHHTTARVLGVIALISVAVFSAWMFFPEAVPEPEVTVQEVEDVEAPPDLMGTVVNRVGGRGIADVTVSVRCANDDETLTEVTDGDGHFSFDALPDGKCTVTLRSDGYLLGGPSAPRDFPVHIGAGDGVPSLRIQLSQRAGIQGRVDGPEGPLAGVTFTLLYLEAPDELEVFSESRDEVTGPQGKFKLSGLLPGRIQVLAEHPVYGFLETEPFYLRPGQMMSDLTLSMVPTGTIVGRVTDLERQPLEGAEVTLSGKGRQRPRTVRSDARGFFQFERALPGPARVTAEHMGYALQAAHEFQVVPDEETEATLRMRRLSGIAGRVLTPEGAPAALSSVYLRQASGRWVKGPAAKTDAQGLFFVAEPEAYPITLRATHPEHGPSEPLVLDARQPTVTLNLTPGGRLIGRLLTEQRQPVGTFTVVAKPIAEDGRSPRGRRERERDEEGRFSLESMSPGRYSLRLVAPGFLPVEVESVEVRAGEVTDVGTLVCSAGGTAVGRMLDQSTGEAVTGIVRVTFTGYGRRAEGAWSRSDSEGYFSVDGLRDQRMTLRFSARGYDTKMVSGLQTQPGEELNLGDVFMQASEDGRRRLQYSGVGAQLRRTRQGIQFMTIFEDSPAADSGVVPGTIIMGINGQSARDMDLRQAVELIRGETGSEVELLVQQPGAAEPEPIVLERRDVVAG